MVRAVASLPQVVMMVQASLIGWTPRPAGGTGHCSLGAGLRRITKGQVACLGHLGGLTARRLQDSTRRLALPRIRRRPTRAPDSNAPGFAVCRSFYGATSSGAFEIPLGGSNLLFGSSR